MEIIRSGGGLIATASAVAAVYEAYPNHLYPEDFRVQSTGIYENLYDWQTHGGALNGVILAGLQAAAEIQ